MAKEVSAMLHGILCNRATLIAGKVSGVAEPQSFINGFFWQIDSRYIKSVTRNLLPATGWWRHNHADLHIKK
jgi:hypothetical protein